MYNSVEMVSARAVNAPVVPRAVELPEEEVVEQPQPIICRSSPSRGRSPSEQGRQRDRRSLPRARIEELKRIEDSYVVRKNETYPPRDNYRDDYRKNDAYCLGERFKYNQRTDDRLDDRDRESSGGRSNRRKSRDHGRDYSPYQAFREDNCHRRSRRDEASLGNKVGRRRIVNHLMSKMNILPIKLLPMPMRRTTATRPSQFRLDGLWPLQRRRRKTLESFPNPTLKPDLA